MIISGQSGAGKSSAMNVFEDAGYFCVDNLPAEMIRALAGLFMHDGSKVERAAVVSDLRGGEYFGGLARVIETLRSDDVAHRVIYLCADDETLLSPLQGDAPAPPARALGQRDRRHPPRGRGARADPRARRLGVDTSGLSAAMLRRKIANELLEEKSPRRLAVTFTSFGHKHGPPRDADLAFDVRFLPNPHYEAELRALTGLRHADRRLRRRATAASTSSTSASIPLLEYLLPQYVAEGKAHLVVAIGCTGGRHRSVVIAEHLAVALPFRRSLLHRDPAPRRRPRTDARLSRPLASSPGT